jgi:hypothetical protein
MSQAAANQVTQPANADSDRPLAVGLGDLLARGRVYAWDNKMFQIDEHCEDDTMTGNQSDIPSNAIVLGEFRSESICAAVVELVNRANMGAEACAPKPTDNSKI